jgi:hypothetical protein
MLWGTAGLAAFSFLAAGPGWPRAYIRMIFSPQVNQGSIIMPNVHGLATGLPHTAALEVVLSVAVAIAALAVSRAARFELALAAALLGGLLMSWHAYPHDCAITIPAMLSVARWARSEIARMLAVICLSPFPYMATLLFGSLGIIPAALFFVVLLAMFLSERLWIAFFMPRESGMGSEGTQ